MRTIIAGKPQSPSQEPRKKSPPEIVKTGGFLIHIHGADPETPGFTPQPDKMRAVGKTGNERQHPSFP